MQNASGVKKDRQAAVDRDILDPCELLLHIDFLAIASQHQFTIVNRHPVVNFLFKAWQKKM